MVQTVKSAIICLEGADGSGKTTQVQLLKHCININGLDVISSREPGGTKIGEELRNIILKEPLNQITNILLYTTVRYNHIQETIIPALNNDNMVILDRYLLSTLVYQGEENLDLINKISLLHKKINKNLYPNLTLILEIDPKIAIQRIQSRKKDNNYYDQKPLSFHQNIAKLYKSMLTYYEGKSDFINANLDIYSIHCNIINSINKNLQLDLKFLEKKQVDNFLKKTCKYE